MSTQLIEREYQGHIFTFRNDGYFNMTAAAKAFGKQLNNFMISPSTQEYMSALSNSLESKELTQASRGRNGGTWGHPKLAVFFARWLDAKFAVFCDMVIDDIIHNKAELTVTDPKESAVANLPKSFAEALRLAADLEEQKEAMELELQQTRPALKLVNETFGEENGRWINISKFARRLTKMNWRMIKKDLFGLGYLYKAGGHYRVYSQYRELITEKENSHYQRTDLYLTSEGQKLIIDLYANGELTLLKRYQDATCEDLEEDLIQEGLI